MTEPEQIDKDIDISSRIEAGKRNGGPGKRKIPGIVWILSIFAIALIVVLILPTDNSSSFNKNISSGEQELRDLMYSIACDIHEFYQLYGRLPIIPVDFDLSSHDVIFTAEDDSSWILQSGDSLIYYSDMDPMEFAEGEL